MITKKGIKERTCLIDYQFVVVNKLKDIVSKDLQQERFICYAGKTFIGVTIVPCMFREVIEGTLRREDTEFDELFHIEEFWGQCWWSH